MDFISLVPNRPILEYYTSFIFSEYGLFSKSLNLKRSEAKKQV